MTTFGVVRRLYKNASRDQDKTYVNVLTQLRQDRREFDVAILHVSPSVGCRAGYKTRAAAQCRAAVARAGAE